MIIFVTADGVSGVEHLEHVPGVPEALRVDRRVSLSAGRRGSRSGLRDRRTGTGRRGSAQAPATRIQAPELLHQTVSEAELQFPAGGAAPEQRSRGRLRPPVRGRLRPHT